MSGDNAPVITGDHPDVPKFDNLLEIQDFPIYTVCDDLRDFIHNLGRKHWTNLQTDQPCSFCHDPAQLHNSDNNLYSCESCHADLTTNETDVLNPGDHPVSNYIHNYFRDWIIRSYWTCSDVNEVYDECEIAHNLCYICKQEILRSTGEDRVEMGITSSGDRYVIGHYECCCKVGFPDLTSEDIRRIMDSPYFVEELTETMDEDY